MLKGVYSGPQCGASSLVVAQFGMESVARQFRPPNEHVMVIRNGWFQAIAGPKSSIWGGSRNRMGLLKPNPFPTNPNRLGFPCRLPTWSLRLRVRNQRLCSLPHVETSAGMILPDDYLKAVADAVHEVGGLLYWICIASGAIWVDMAAHGR